MSPFLLEFRGRFTAFGAPMAEHKDSRGGPGSSDEPSAAQAATLRPFEDAISRARARMEDYVAAWAEDLASAREERSEEAGARGKERLAEAEGRLDRLCEALRSGPTPLDTGVLASSPPHTDAQAALERTVGEHEGAERVLAAANAELRRQIADAEIDPACLVFELTETTAIANIEEARAFAYRLRARGCRLALDDFGAGFGSFYYLKSLPFDSFKIDGDFIRGIVASPMDQLLVAAIVGIARGMGKKTIAEFVADDETAVLLEKSGVDFAQGYHVGRPGPVRDVLPPM
jgi:hypothetical protein